MIPYIYLLSRSFIGFFFLLIGALAFGQKPSPGVHPPLVPQHSLQVPKLPAPFGLDAIPKIQSPEFLLEHQPIAKNTQRKPFLPMPIAYPDLQGYQMPIHKPSGDVNYSLLVVPFNPPLELPEID